jgi:hypothetical protein
MTGKYKDIHHFGGIRACIRDSPHHYHHPLTHRMSSLSDVIVLSSARLGQYIFHLHDINF